MTDRSNDHYETLGVDPKATPEEIRAAWRRKAREIHPGRQGERPSADRELATEELKHVNRAYQTLRDRETRRAYDRQRDREVSGAGAAEGSGSRT